MNKENMAALADFMESQVSVQFNMKFVLTGLDDGKVAWCGTAGCIAGFELIRTDSLDPFGKGTTLGRMRRAAVSLGLNEDQRQALFMPNNSVVDYNAYEGNKTYISRELAIQALRLASERGSMRDVWRDAKRMLEEEEESCTKRTS